jgi:hypothetical protein
MTGRELLDWLLEPENPSVRYLALRDLLGRPEDDPDVASARAAIGELRQVRAILDAQYPAGYWIKPDRGYSPKHKATIWQLIFLCDLGMPCTAAIARACEHVIDAALRPEGLFSAHVHSTGLLPCLNGDLLRVLWHFGYGASLPGRTVAASLSQRVLADGWICVRNGTRPRDRSSWQPCPWGCIKVLRGLASIPAGLRSPEVLQAIDHGTHFLLSVDLARDVAPALVDVPSYWLRFGFPLGYGSDLLEALLALTELGVVPPGRAVRIVHDKRGARERWPLEHAIKRSWTDFGTQGQPSKWVTLRALKVLSHYDHNRT